MVSGYYEKLAENFAITMTQIPAGEFQMGSPENEVGRQSYEGPQHQVKLRSFFTGPNTGDPGPVAGGRWLAKATTGAEGSTIPFTRTQSTCGAGELGRGGGVLPAPECTNWPGVQPPQRSAMGICLPSGYDNSLQFCGDFDTGAGQLRRLQHLCFRAQGGLSAADHRGGQLSSQWLGAA